MAIGWWKFVGGNWLVAIGWWQLVGGNSLVAIGWWQSVGGKGGGRRRKEERIPHKQTKTPHINVGNKVMCGPGQESGLIQLPTTWQWSSWSKFRASSNRPAPVAPPNLCQGARKSTGAARATLSPVFRTPFVRYRHHERYPSIGRHLTWIGHRI